MFANDTNQQQQQTSQQQQQQKPSTEVSVQHQQGQKKQLQRQQQDDWISPLGFGDLVESAFNDPFFRRGPMSVLAASSPFFDPAREIQSMTKAMDKTLRDISRQMDWSPSADITSNKDAYIVHADLPGVSKENVSVNLDHNKVLTIKGERKVEKKDEDKDHKYHRVERSFGSFVRRFQLPDDVDPKKVKAVFENGVLKVTITKSPKEEQMNNIPIE
jgi:HSP20 family protein